MTSHVSSSDKGAERLSKAMMRCTVLLCLIAGPILSGLASDPQSKRSSEERDRYRFQVADADSDLPVPGAEVCLTYLHKKGTTEVRKGIEVKADTNGRAEFPRLEAHKLIVSVTANGYPSQQRWI